MCVCGVEYILKDCGTTYYEEVKAALKRKLRHQQARKEHFGASDISVVVLNDMISIGSARQPESHNQGNLPLRVGA